MFIAYHYCKKYNELIAIELCRQQKLNADRNSIQQIKFTGILLEKNVQQCFSLLKKQKKPF